MRPDAAFFQAHIEAADFQTGVDKNMWGFAPGHFEAANWPLSILWIQAAAKLGQPDKYYFKFDLAGYPSHAPTACPWDLSTNMRLESHRWPRGRKFVSNTFNYGWNPNALYAPCDRIAMSGHEAWRAQFPDLWWQPSFSITVYLNFLHRLLNSSDYVNS